MSRGMTIACGQRRRAVTIGSAEWTPKLPRLVGGGHDDAAGVRVDAARR